MPVILWGVLAVAAGFAALWIFARTVRRRSPPLPADVELPATPLQKVARWSVGAGLVLALAAAALVVVNGPRTWYEDDTIRLTFTFLVLAALGVVSAATVWLSAQARRRDGLLDERDKAILDRAPAMQGPAMLVTLAIWMVGLVEHFHGAGAVPTYYLYLVFWSCLLVNLLGLPVGVLVGYRRS
jgi:high-affinity Fe2+/Pb2+ permease